MKRFMTVLAVGLACGCSSATDPISQQLEGDWDWVESSGGIAGMTHTPASTGETMRLSFSATGIVELVRDGVLAAATTYVTELAADGGSPVVRYGQSLHGFEVQTVAFDGDDVLVLIDPCCDGFTFRFSRSL